MRGFSRALNIDSTVLTGSSGSCWGFAESNKECTLFIGYSWKLSGFSRVVFKGFHGSSGNSIRILQFLKLVVEVIGVFQDFSNKLTRILGAIILAFSNIFMIVILV